MTDKMKAIRLTHKCDAKDLKPEEVDKPQVKPGYDLVRVKAFGVNESEVTSRKGESSADFSFPRILGIEGVGVVEESGEGCKLKPGQQVATMMQGLGRSIDGSYAEYMLVKEENLIPFESDLDWGTLGAIPEMVQTANGSVTTGLQLESSDVLLVHGGSSTVGLAASAIAKSMGATVISTTRSAAKEESLKEYGADYVLLDDASLNSNVEKIAPSGIDKVLELVGADKVASDMSLLKKDGKLCFTGALDNTWTFEGFSPYAIPNGTYLTAYAGGVHDLPADALAEIIGKIEDGKLKLPIAKVYNGLESVGEAQANLESGKFIGKHVVVL